MKNFFRKIVGENTNKSGSENTNKGGKRID
jgi:hypothetical protein